MTEYYSTIKHMNLTKEAEIILTQNNKSTSYDHYCIRLFALNRKFSKLSHHIRNYNLIIMGALAVIFFTFFWGFIGIGLRSFVPIGTNQGLIKTGLSLAAACCYTLWLCTYMAQMNPLFGPQLDRASFLLLKKYLK